MNGAGLFFLLLLLLVILPIGVWVGYTRWRAHKQGLPPPPLSAYIPFKGSSSNYPVSPRPSGVVGWVQDKFNAIKNRGTALGGGGSTADEAHSRGRGSFSQLDPDGAWDDRVGHEADAYGRIGDYEEQELGMHPGAGSGTAYGDAYQGRGDRGQVMPPYGTDDARGRSRTRDDLSYVGGGQQGLNQRYDEETRGPNPFGDEHEAGSLRGVSPRPVAQESNGHVDGGYSQTHQKKGSGDTTKTGRQSMFHEDM